MKLYAKREFAWLEDQLVGHWNPLLTGINGGVVADSSLRNNQAIATGYSAIDNGLGGSIYGSVMRLDGTGGFDVGINALNGLPSGSVLFWVKAGTALGIDASPVFTSLGDNWPYIDGKIYTSLFRSASRVNNITPAANLQNWNFFCCTTRSGGTWNLYQNNSLIGTASAESVIASTTKFGLVQNFKYTGDIAWVISVAKEITKAESDAAYFAGPTGIWSIYPDRRRSVSIAAGFKAYWHRRQSQIIGGGLR